MFGLQPSGLLQGRLQLRRGSVAAAAIPYGPPPVPTPPQLPSVSFQQPAAFPTLPAAPSLNTDFVDERATEPHWGSRLLNDTLDAAAARMQAAEPPGAAQLSQALQELQQALSDNVGRLESLSGAAGGRLEQLELGGAGELQEGLASVAAQLQRVAEAAQQAAAAAAGAAQLDMAVLPPSGQAAGEAAASLANQLAELSTAEYAGYSLQTLGLVTAGVAALVALSVPRGRGDDDQPGGSGGFGSGSSSGGGSAGSRGGASGDVLPTSWDPEAVELFYQRRPTLVARRVLEVASEAAAYGAALLADMAAGSVDANMQRRADQAMQSIERLGPAYVKVAQAMSTRVDLLPPPYLVAIQRLQDRVPPFSDAEAYACIERAFGRPLGQVFSSLSESAVAAASLGQVYRGALRETGRDVAIKVRRPGVLESVSLDLHLMRQVALYLRTVPQVRSDWVGIIDNWARRFLDEMNYELEADNTRQFQRDLGGLAGIVIPDVISEGSTTDVLVLGWVEGERLTDSKAEDVRQLCDTLLSAYLIQLLDTGLLHADPHPGNLLRTPEGRIALLDHGLIQEIPRDYALALMEYIAHLSIGDWDSLVDDLVALGFVDSVDDKESLVGPLGAILTELTAGGGAKKVNITMVMEEIDKMTTLYEFRVPPYFALILRTFSVIEGIALQVDPDYSIVRECFPYLSRRLLTDDDPRAQQALKEILFAGGDHISLERLELVVRGLQEFTVEGLGGSSVSGAPSGPASASSSSASGTASTAVAAPASAGARKPLLDSTSKEVLSAIFSKQPTYVQQLLVNEAVGTVDAAGRQLAATLLGPALGNLAAAQAAMRGGNGAAQGGLIASSGPLPAPLALLNRLPSLVELSPEDRQQLATAQGITALILQQQQAAPGAGSAARMSPQQAAALAQQLASELGPLLPQLLPGVAATGQMFVQELGKRTADRVAAVVAGPQAGGSGGDDPNYRAPMDL